MSHWLFNKEHKIFRKSLRNFFENELTPHVVEWEKAGTIPRSFYEQIANMGYIGISLPEKFGGSNSDLVTEAVFLEELGKSGTGGISISVIYHLTALSLLSLYGNEEQKAKYLEPAIRGKKVATVAVEQKTEAQLHAKRTGGGFQLNGMKTFVTNGVSADFFCVIANTDEGMSLFVVERELPGISVEREIEKLGWRACDTADIGFHEVNTEKTHQLGNNSVSRVNQWLFVMLALVTVSLAEKSLEDTIRYSKERKQFGRTINKFQVLQHKMADMAVEIEKTKNLTYRALYLLNEGEDAEMEAMMAKVHAGEMAKKVTDSAVQIHGGMGYMMETPVQRYWRDARGISVIGGTTQALTEQVSARMQSSIGKETERDVATTN